MSKYTIWAKNLPEDSVDITAPDLTHIQSGWFKSQYPPHEWFNWYFRQTDTRLTAVEAELDTITEYSLSGTRATDMAAGDAYTVPQYIKGSKKLKVYLDGVPCECNDDPTKGAYQEDTAAADGDVTTTIYWHQTIPTKFDIVVTAPKELTYTNTFPSNL